MMVPPHEVEIKPMGTLILLCRPTPKYQQAALKKLQSGASRPRVVALGADQGSWTISGVRSSQRSVSCSLWLMLKRRMSGWLGASS